MDTTQQQYQLATPTIPPTYVADTVLAQARARMCVIVMTGGLMLGAQLELAPQVKLGGTRPQPRIPPMPLQYVQEE